MKLTACALDWGKEEVVALGTVVDPIEIEEAAAVAAICFFLYKDTENNNKQRWYMFQ